jgi:hypothetical protein
MDDDANVPDQTALCLYECVFVLSPVTVLFVCPLPLHLVSLVAQVCLFRRYKHLDFVTDALPSDVQGVH